MPERDQPDLDHVRDAMREHDRHREATDDAAPPEPGERDGEDDGGDDDDLG